jgi:pimeloyl-ACP methyl ester carboxylesterase
MPVLYISLLVLVLAATLLLALAYWIADLLLHSRRQPLMRTPESVGLAYETITFTSRDGLVLHGWWIPAGPAAADEVPRAVVLLHPMFGNRSGLYAGWQPLLPSNAQDLDLVEMASGLRAAGLAVLLFDFRNHGESGAGVCGGGLTEDQDVTAALDYAFARMGAELPATVTAQIGVVGFGLGAAAAIAAAGREKGGAETLKVFGGDSEGGSGFVEFAAPSAKRLAFLVAVQPAAQETLLRSQLHHTAAPLAPVLVPLVDKICQRRGGYPLGAAFLLKFAPEVHVPTLYIQARADAADACSTAQQLFALTPDRKEILWLEEPKCRGDGYAYACTHLEPLLAFARASMPTDRAAIAANEGNGEP